MIWLPEMANDYFELVPQIVEDKKYIDVSRPEIVRALEANGSYDTEFEHTTVDDFANKVTVVLRININCQHPTYPEGWTFTLKLHNTRVDGFDHEEKFVGMDGAIYSGWHRHLWNVKARSAEKDKALVSDLDGISSREEFVIRVLKLMHTTVSATDYGQDLLPFA